MLLINRHQEYMFYNFFKEQIFLAARAECKEGSHGARVMLRMGNSYKTRRRKLFVQLHNHVHISELH